MTQKAVSLSDSVLQISKDLKSLIDEYVGEELKNHSLIEDKYNHLVSFLKEEIERAEELYEDYKNNNFTVNSIEAEGALRAMRTIEGMLKQIESW